MKFKICLINVGRDNINQEYEQEANDLDEMANLVYAKIQIFLLSSEVCLEPVEKNEESWNVIVGGFRKVGDVKIIELK